MWTLGTLISCCKLGETDLAACPLYSQRTFCDIYIYIKVKLFQQKIESHFNSQIQAWETEKEKENGRH